MANTTFIRPPSVARPSRGALPADVRWMRLTANGLYVLAALVFAALAVHLLTRQPVFALRAIQLSGDLTRNSVATIRVNAVPQLRGNFFTLDLQAARHAFESVPWVRQAVVRRDFPNRLLVKLQEHQAVAYWGGEGDSQLINSYGEVFEANVGEVEQDMLPRLSGPEGQSVEVLNMYRTLTPLYMALGLDVEEMELTGRGSWRVHLDNGADIEMGRGSIEEVAARVQRFLKTVTQVAARYGRHANAVESADLRHDNGYAVKLRGVSTTVADAPKK